MFYVVDIIRAVYIQVCPSACWCIAHEQVLEFYSYVFKTAQLEKDCVIMSLVYIERVLTETAGKLRIFRKNWR